MDLKPRKRNMVSEYFNGLAEKYGGTLETESQRIDADGQRTVERTVKHFPPPKTPKAGGQVAHSRPRARGTGRRPRVATRSSAKSGDSGDSDLSDEPDPPRRGPKLCEFCSGELPPGKRRYCSTLHADRDRQRRKRHKDRAQDRLPVDELARLLTAAVCRCNGHHIALKEDDEELGQRCARCGRQRPESTAGQELRRRLQQLAHDEGLWSKIDREARDRSERLR